MSTRANIVINDGYSKLFFYRHSDGYPDGARPLLDKFMQLIIEGKIRNNTSQAAGWLIMLGAMEYYDYNKIEMSDKWQDFTPKDWKVGAIEPTTGIHGDISWFYVVDLAAKTVGQYESGNIPKEYEQD